MTFNSGAGMSVAGQSVNGSTYLTFNGGGSLQTSQSGVPGDPFAGKLTAPTPAGTCTPDPNYKSGTGNLTIPSGTYCALSITGGTNLVLSGTYIITQGKFNF